MPAAKYTRRPSNDELQGRYIDEGQHCTQIAQLCGADPKTIWAWLREAGIPTRKRGTNPAVHFQRGHTMRLGKRHSAETIAKVRAATIARGGVPYLRNGAHWMKGQPPSANGRYRGGLTPERQQFYRSAEWKAACVIVWRRANACCERCGIDHRKIDRRKNKFHVHHITSFQIRQLRAEPTNLALLCRDCHMFVHHKRNAGAEFLACPVDRALCPPDLFASIEREDAA